MTPDPHPAADEPQRLAALPRDAEGPVFAAPWEAQAFALAVALEQGGAFTRLEWAQALGGEIARAQAAGDPDAGDTYYHHWLAALERLLADKRIVEGATRARYRDAWAHAAGRTPHGEPIELEPEDFSAHELVSE